LVPTHVKIQGERATRLTTISTRSYLANLSLEAAEKTINRIQKAVLMLSDFPAMGTKVDETGLHRLVVSDTPR